jgi:hypothetical protein
VKFDWYGASVEADADEVLGTMSEAFDMASFEPCRSLYGYNRAQCLKRGDSVLATVMWEGRGDAATTGCFVQGTGRHAAPVASFLRGWEGVAHSVARADVAEDYAGEGAWDRLSKTCLEVADKHAVKVEHAGDWHRGLDGRSIYLGGRQSVAREICYEKGKQIGGDPDHVRMELRVRPHGPGKSLAAKATPLELYGSARWSLDLCGRLGHPEVQRLSLGTVYRDDDIARARRALLRQYGPTLIGLRDELGTWTAAGDWIGSQLKT